MGFTSVLYFVTVYLVRDHYVRGLYIIVWGCGSRGCYGRGMQQVPTQGIANWGERWSFVILGEDGVEEADYMNYEREINYHGYEN